MRRILGMIAAAAAVVAGLGLADDDDSKTPKARREATEALRPFGPLVGSWRGTGQPQRGRSQGSWTEKASWAWKLSDDSAALEIEVESGKYLKSALLRPGDGAGRYVLEAVLADGTKRTFRGKAEPDKPLVLVATEAGEGLRRVTLTTPNELRFLLLLEAQAGPKAAYARLGEVGFTRNGVSFAAGESGPVCIVTEGRGTIQVSYQGKTYYVCCSGCKDLFTKDPAAILAEAAARKQK